MENEERPVGPAVMGGVLRPKVLVIAGYDQSGGAGLLADIKTLEAHGVYGYGVCTAMTYQNEREIRRVDWMREADVLEQIDVCFASADLEWVKIGITASMGSAAAIIRHVRKHNSAARVVLDPVIKATCGTAFWEGTAAWEELMAECFVLTPNWEEIGLLYPGEDVEQRCRELSRKGSIIYLKGGHNPGFPGRDTLWSQGEPMVMEADKQVGIVYPKHGSGCVLASALTAGLALGYPLPVAALRARQYTAAFLTSNKSLLGWHRWNGCIS
jgi:hydroxymethylpyrimidine/phosphomethylpyrimidine kinase